MHHFIDLGLTESIANAVDALGFEKPTPIQREVIPFMLINQTDLVALAQTGTGKTAAYGLPIIQEVDINNKATQYLILAPTRELCNQITKDLNSFAKNQSKIKIAAVYGGTNVAAQIKEVKKGAHIICATPGRLIDLINRKVVKLGAIKTLVLDEADEMLNMGFREDIEEILKSAPQKRRTVLFSATMPDEVRKIASSYMVNPEEITVGRKNAGAEDVEHFCYFVHAKDRYAALKRIADYYPDIYGIIFCRTKRETQEVADNLIKDGYDAEPLHGDLSQLQRDAVMDKFRSKHLKLLVATDVASRGLDVSNLTHIINYNLPDELEVYTHRSGRTGRAGKTGVSIIIANLKEKGKISQIERKLGKKFKHAHIPTGNEICEKQLFNLIDRMKNVKVDEESIGKFLPAVNEKLNSLSKNEIIKRFVSLEFNRFLEYYSDYGDLSSPEVKSKSRVNDLSYTRLFLNLGKTDGLKPQTLIGMVNDFTRQKNIDIGEIEILKNFSFFEIENEYTELVLKAFRKKKLKNREINIEVAEKKKSQQPQRHEMGRAKSRKFKRKSKSRF